MNHNKKASGKISRRTFAKTVATSIIAAPIISAHPKKLQTVHIPPIVISSGSVTLYSQDGVSDLPESASGEQPICPAHQDVEPALTEYNRRVEHFSGKRRRNAEQARLSGSHATV